MKKLNCWEFMRCGRELGGHTRHLGVCPSAFARRLNGVHSGIHGGRACWVVAGTLCSGNGHGSFAEKYQSCEQCDFYKAVRKEEGGNFILSAVLLRTMP